MSQYQPTDAEKDAAIAAIIGLAERYHNRPRARATVLQVEHVKGKHYRVIYSPVNSGDIWARPATANGRTAVYMGEFVFYANFESIIAIEEK